MPIMLDLCCGLGGASEVFKENGWDVFTLDVEHIYKSDFVKDVRTWIPPDLFKIKLLWASPPCIEFSRYAQRGLYVDQGVPDMSIYYSVKRLIEIMHPEFYVIENVKGAVPFFGENYISFGSFYLWTNIPYIGANRSRFKNNKKFITGGKKRISALRARIPRDLSLEVLRSVSSFKRFSCGGF